MFESKTNLPSPINIKRELEKYNQRYVNNQSSYFNAKAVEGAKTSFFNPYRTSFNWYGNLKTIDRYTNRDVSCETLRRVAKKAWLINACILNVQRKIKPFLKPSTNKNNRGFVIHKKGETVEETLKGGKTNKKIIEIQEFMSNCGADENSDRDTLVKYGMKLVRDVSTIDQVSTEIIRDRSGKVCGFIAIDSATIEKVAPNQDNPQNIKYVQIIDSIPHAYYNQGSIVVDYMNPRTDIEYSNYGYSFVEQAVDLVTSHINTFCYNSGFFTENKLPKGMLLVNGDPDQDNVEMMEDYITDIMSGNPSSQWRIPIIPSGSEQGDIKWVQLGGNNREMEFQQWLDFLTSGIVCLFGCSMEELGLQSAKSQAMFERNNAPYLEASKSLVLGDMLSFLQDYLNRILSLAYPDYEFEFVGYEKEDQKAVVDITKSELESYKTLNEVRVEKGLPKIKAEWADQCPANPQFVQMFQAAQQQDMGGDMGEDGFGDEGGEDEGNDGGVDEGAWADIGGDNVDGDDTESVDNSDGDDNSGETDTEINKSINIW